MRGVINKLWANKKLVYVFLIVLCVFNGLVVAYFTHDSSLHTGDNSTFYAFARSISNGEDIYDDFIHFRTPGSYFIQASFIELLGDSQKTVDFAIKVEALVLYPLAFLIAAMIIFRKRSLWFVIFAYVCVVLLPPYLQLRAGLGLLSIACMIAALSASTRNRKRWLLASGILAGLTFTFGQEVFLMVSICLLASLITLHGKDLRGFIRSAGLVSGGAILGLAPLLFYVLTRADIGTFLYYVSYYSFVLQPQHMNVPFPNLGHKTLIYYLPFLLYLLCFVVLLLNPRLGKKEALLLSFGVVRLITALGRSDIGHLVFVLPEIFLIVPYFMASSTYLVKKYLSSRLFWLSLASLILIFYLSVNKSGAFMVLAPGVIIGSVALRGRLGKIRQLNKPWGLNLYMTMGAIFLLVNYLLFPQYMSTLRVIKNSMFTDSSQALRISGMKTDPVTYRHIQEVRQAVDVHNPRTIFSFPIQPFYYSFAPKHAARYFTFEPQTTLEEQQKTVEDLQRTKPEVIILDPLQAYSLSGSVWLISDYITSNYKVSKEIVNREIVWIMVPKEAKEKEYKLALSLYRHNETGVATVIHNRNDGLVNAIQQNGSSIEFKFSASNQAKLSLSIVKKSDSYGDCGYALITFDNKKIRKSICSSERVVDIPIPESEDVSIELVNQSKSPIIWNNPSLVEN